MKLVPIFILLTVTLASASCKRTVVEDTVVSYGPTESATIVPISPPQSPPVDTQASAGQCVSYHSPEGIRGACAETVEKAWEKLRKSHHQKVMGCLPG